MTNVNPLIRPVTFDRARSLTGEYVGIHNGPNEPALVVVELESPLGNSGLYEMTPEKALRVAAHLKGMAELVLRMSEEAPANAERPPGAPPPGVPLP